jgi:hypothetical protein
MAELLRSDSAQARSMIRTRDASGRETAQDLLHGIQQEEAQRFDHEWMTSAQQSLYPALGGRQASRPSQTQRQYALPTSTHHQPSLDPAYRSDRPHVLTDSYATGALPYHTSYFRFFEWVLFSNYCFCNELAISKVV